MTPSPSQSRGAEEQRIRSAREAKLATYRTQRDELQAELKTLNNRRSRVSKRLKDIGNAIYDLLHESAEVPSVTDHAVVRYLERVEGMDIRALKAKVANHESARRENNTIVTVLEARDDAQLGGTDLVATDPDAKNSLSNPPNNQP